MVCKSICLPLIQLSTNEVGDSLITDAYYFSFYFFKQHKKAVINDGIIYTRSPFPAIMHGFSCARTPQSSTSIINIHDEI